MAIGIATNLNVNAGAPLDNKYGPYIGTTEALAKTAADNATEGQRYKGLTVGLIIGSNALTEYWYQDGSTLEKKVTTAPTTGVTKLTIASGESFLTIAPVGGTGDLTISTSKVQSTDNLIQNVTSTDDDKYPSAIAVKTYADTKSSKAFAIAMAAAL